MISRLPTSEAISAWRAGTLTEVIVPAITAAASRCQACNHPAMSSAAMASATDPATSWDKMTIRVRSNRSASTPPNGESTSSGPIRATDIRLSQSGDLVSS